MFSEPTKACLLFSDTVLKKKKKCVRRVRGRGRVKGLFFFFPPSDCLSSVLEVHAETITTRKISQDLFYALWLPAPASTRCSLDALVGELGFLLRRYGHSWSRSLFSTHRPPSGTGGVRGLSRRK